jgi:lactococcin 972 family bacteriocin
MVIAMGPVGGHSSWTGALTPCVLYVRRMRYITLKQSSYVTAALGAALVAALALPTTASASAVGLVGDQASGGSAVITGGEGTQVVVDDTAEGVRPQTTQRVGGGVWIYGIGGGNSYSYYDHSGKTHKSTACAGFGTSCRSSGWVAKGTRSVAQVLRTAGGNTAFWDTK